MVKVCFVAIKMPSNLTDLFDYLRKMAMYTHTHTYTLVLLHVAVEKQQVGVEREREKAIVVAAIITVAYYLQEFMRKS